MSRYLLLLPVALFVGLGMVLWQGFFLDDAHRLPSALVDRSFPEFDLPLLAGAGRAQAADLPRPALVNVWATWCPTCQAEHAELLRIRADTGIAIVGVNYKDDVTAARGWLAQQGDPYVFSVVDGDGRLGLDLGVYGAPETFVVDAEGVIRWKWVGDINPRVWRDRLQPVLVELGMVGP